MVTSMWFLSLAALLVVDVRIRALQQKDAASRRCYHCANGTSCDVTRMAVVECQGDRPLCATSAVSPNFTSELTCGAAAKTPCSLTLTTEALLTLICTCPEHLCSTPFTEQLQKQLLNFSLNFTKHNSSDYTDIFFRSSSFANVSEGKLYEGIKLEKSLTTETPAHNSSFTTVSAVMSTSTTISHSVGFNLPRAEAFKQEPTALSEDDEDASEGSGSYEETRTQRQPASDPADPSSFLPANENKAPPLAATFLVTTIINLYFVA